MGMLSNLLKNIRPLELEDPYFGSIVYMKMPQGCTSYWEASRTFQPLRREVELFIDAPAPEQPPADLQQQFFAEVESRYQELLHAVESMLRPQFETWLRRPLPGPFADEFTLSSFSIPHARLSVAEWEIYFESKTDARHLFIVTLNGLVARGVTLDG